MGNKTSEYVNSVFEQPWWLDVVSPNQWKEILVEEDGVIVARWPIVIRGNSIGMPKLTQTLGFWLSDQIVTSDPYYKERKRIINLLLDQLPKNMNINIRLNPNVDYFLPMYWRHYVINPCVSYRINDLTDINNVYNRFSNTVKKNIRRASNKVTIKSTDDIEILIMLMEKTFSNQNRKLPISKDLIRNIYSTCKDHNSGRLLYAFDNDGIPYSGAFSIFDKNVCYALIGGTDPKYKNSGAHTLLLWEEIQFASTVSKNFDFEGSMVEGIEDYFRQFGSKPSIYYQIHKQNIFFEFFELLKPKIKSFIGYKI